MSVDELENQRREIFERLNSAENGAGFIYRLPVAGRAELLVGDVAVRAISVSLWQHGPVTRFRQDSETREARTRDKGF